jgi:hypothetical protein
MNDAPKHPASLVHREIVLEQHLVSQLVQRDSYDEGFDLATGTIFWYCSIRS